MKQEQVFGGISYEYAIGCIQASSRPPLSQEQWNRFQSGSFSQGLGLLRELGCPVRDNFLDALEEDWQNTAAFVREISPQPELTQLLFFEEDALNLKLCRKAVLGGLSRTELPVQPGSLEPQLLWVCAENNDYSLLGQPLETALAPLQDTTDPCQVSCVIDNAFFARANPWPSREEALPWCSCWSSTAKGKISSRPGGCTGWASRTAPLPFSPRRNRPRSCRRHFPTRTVGAGPSGGERRPGRSSVGGPDGGDRRVLLPKEAGVPDAGPVAL